MIYYYVKTLRYIMSTRIGGDANNCKFIIINGKLVPA